jgi:hypothetical protein
VLKELARKIAKELETAKHYAVYEPELARLCPKDRRPRETQIALFAQKHGWRLRYYKDGLCAIFDKEPSR